MADEPIPITVVPDKPDELDLMAARAVAGLQQKLSEIQWLIEEIRAASPPPPSPEKLQQVRDAVSEAEYLRNRLIERIGKQNARSGDSPDPCD